MQFCIDGYTDSLAFNTSFWKLANGRYRSAIYGHGFHHNLCKNKTYHKFESKCESEQCDKKCNNRYHISISEKKIVFSLKDLNQNKITAKYQFLKLAGIVLLLLLLNLYHSFKVFQRLCVILLMYLQICTNKEFIKKCNPFYQINFIVYINLTY